MHGTAESIASYKQVIIFYSLLEVELVAEVVLNLMHPPRFV